MADRTFNQQVTYTVPTAVERWELLEVLEGLVHQELGNYADFHMRIAIDFRDGQLQPQHVADVDPAERSWDRINSVTIYAAADESRKVMATLWGSVYEPIYKDGELRISVTSERQSEAMGWAAQIEKKIDAVTAAAQQAEAERLEAAKPKRESLAQWWGSHHRDVIVGLIIGLIGAVVGAVVTALIT